MTPTTTLNDSYGRVMRDLRTRAIARCSRPASGRAVANRSSMVCSILRAEMKRPGFFLLLAGSVLVFGCATRPAETSKRSRPDGRENAARKSELLTAEKRAEAHARYAVGLSYDFREEREQAVEEFQKSALADPSNEPLVIDVVKRWLQQKEPEKAIEFLSQASGTGPASGPVLSWRGIAQAQAGKNEDAIATYEALYKTAGTDSILADFARLQAASLRLDQADWSEMQNRLINLTDNANAWKFSARELMAVAALKAGQIEQARKFGDLLMGERKVPPSILERIKVLMASVVAAELAVATPAVPSAVVPKAEPAKSPEAVKPAEEKKKK